jgi:hypothetical protein
MGSKIESVLRNTNINVSSYVESRFLKGMKVKGGRTNLGKLGGQERERGR